MVRVCTTVSVELKVNVSVIWLCEWDPCGRELMLGRPVVDGDDSGPELLEALE